MTSSSSRTALLGIIAIHSHYVDPIRIRLDPRYGRSKKRLQQCPGDVGSRVGVRVNRIGPPQLEDSQDDAKASRRSSMTRSRVDVECQPVGREGYKLRP